MSYIIPAMIIMLIIYALAKGVDVYDAFISGAAEALPMIVSILPYMAAMMMAITVFRHSGAMDKLVSWLAPACRAIGLPPELFPLFVLRPFSGNGAVALLQDVYAQHGPDGFLGYAASIMLGSTETIFYTISLYLGSVKISKTRHALPVSLAAGAVGAAAAIVFARIAGV